MLKPSPDSKQLLSLAKKTCESSNVKFTKLRQQVLSIILDAQKPLGAYEIISRLEIVSDREKIAPPTVYRTLEFLIEHNLVLRVNSLNAFVPKLNINNHDLAVLFICKHCGFYSEAPAKPVQQCLNLVANELRFKPEHESFEVLGVCTHCTHGEAHQHE